MLNFRFDCWIPCLIAVFVAVFFAAGYHGEITLHRPREGTYEIVPRIDISCKALIPIPDIDGFMSSLSITK